MSTLESTSAVVREGRRVSPDVIEYRDDDCQGFVFRVVRGNDGDFHLSLAPDRERLARADDSLDHRGMKADDVPWFRISVRICTHAGGGRFAHLYPSARRSMARGGHV